MNSRKGERSVECWNREKREQIAWHLKRRPKDSDGEIAALVRCEPKEVAVVRRELRGFERDVELIYQPMATKIDALKVQMTRAAYYGLLVLARLTGFTRLFNGNPQDPDSAIVLVAVIVGGISTGLSFYHVTKSEKLILDRRRIIGRLEEGYLASWTRSLLDKNRSETYYSAL